MTSCSGVVGSKSLLFERFTVLQLFATYNGSVRLSNYVRVNCEKQSCDLYSAIHEMHSA